MAGKKNFAKKQLPDGRIRQSQVVTTFGPGAVIDLLDHSVIVGGLEFWRYDNAGAADVGISAPRLRDWLAYNRQLNLSTEAPFRNPPAGAEEATRDVGIRVFEFPMWFVCQNPACRQLVGRRSLSTKGKRAVHDCERTPQPCVPVRFFSACRKGHISDFPWARFAHPEGAACGAPRLRLEEGKSGDFSEVRVRCLNCDGNARPLRDAMAPTGLFGCSGARPWLGARDHEECEEKTRLMVRTASNTYFPHIESALSIPDPGKEIEGAVDAQWGVLKAATAETLAAFRTIPAVADAIGKYSDAAVLAVVNARKSETPAPREALRTAEFKQFLAAPLESPGEGPGANPTIEYFARKLEGPLPGDGCITRVVLVHKLLEVRAQIGFSRIEPPVTDALGELDLGTELAPMSTDSDWLPATRIRGEGVFIQFDEAAIQAWENRPQVIQRGQELLAGYNAWTEGRKEAPPFPGVRFYLLHSLSHLLVSAVSVACGYAASAIRERLYCAPSTDETPMAGILLSTGSAGSEGTLGGLVEQGRHLGDHFARAFDMGTLCSSDPVCANHTPQNDHTERFLEGAACHGCLYIAEPSCERFNRFLDRTLVVPTLGYDPEQAFLGRRP